MAAYDVTYSPYIGANNFGLDPSKLRTKTIAGWDTGSTSMAPTVSTVYEGPEGTYENVNGEWVGSGGQRIGGDLSAYLKMRGQVAQGSDFGVLQNRLNSLIADPKSITKDPAYQFRLSQGNQAINRSAAAKGMLGSGNVLAELAKFGQGMASEEYGTQLNRLSDLINQRQRFGSSVGYFAEPPRTTTGWEGGALVSRREQNPTYW